MNDEKIPINEDADNFLVKQYEECQITLFEMLKQARADERAKIKQEIAEFDDMIPTPNSRKAGEAIRRAMKLGEARGVKKGQANERAKHYLNEREITILSLASVSTNANNTSFLRELVEIQKKIKEHNLNKKKED